MAFDPTRRAHKIEEHTEGGAAHEVLRRILRGKYLPLFSIALWLEYEDLFGRPVWADTTTAQERHEILAALAQAGRWYQSITAGGQIYLTKAIIILLNWPLPVGRRPLRHSTWKCASRRW